MRQKEGILDDKIHKYCEELDIWCMKTGGQGIPDVIMCINGRFVAFETKVGKNKLSVLQIWQCGRIQKSGGLTYEIRDFKSAKEKIDELKKVL